MSRIASQTLQAAVLVTLLWSTAVATLVADDTISSYKIGCFADNNQGFLIDTLRKDIEKTSNITNTCITHCESEGTLFAAVTNHTICTCGIMYDIRNKTADTECNVKCDEGFTCGGKAAATLYKITPKPCPLPNSIGYFEFYHFCYRFEWEKPLDWKDAEQKCVSEGGHLVSVHNPIESYFLRSLYSSFKGVTDQYPHLWIGGFLNDNKEFEWTDGTPMDFDQWRIGHPKLNVPGNKCLNLMPSLPSDKDKGSWKAWNCDWKNPFVCKRLFNPSEDDQPHVYQVRSGAATACIPVNADKFLNNSESAVQAIYPLLVTDVVGVTVKGRGPIPATATYTHFKKDGPKKEHPSFDNTGREMIKFDGNEQLIEDGNAHSSGTYELSVAAWVSCADLGPSPPKEMIIVSKSKYNGNELAWALSIERGLEYCLRVGTLKTCTTNENVKKMTVQHVTAIYYGSKIRIIINGELVSVSSSEGGEATKVPDSDHLVIGGAYQVNGNKEIVDNNFKGELQDVRVYGLELDFTDANYLYSCSGRTTTNIVHLYEGAPAILQFNGKQLKRHMPCWTFCFHHAKTPQLTPRIICPYS